jgi:putative membrane protein
MAMGWRPALAAMAIMAVPAIAQAMPTPEYLTKAGQGDLYERQSSKEVLESANPRIRAFATMMIADHTQSTQMVRDAAASAGFHPMPAELSPRQLRMLADLRAARGERRDAIYLDQQREGHLDALKLHQDYALNGGIPAIKATAAKIVPVVQHHIAELDKLRPM